MSERWEVWFFPDPTKEEVKFGEYDSADEALKVNLKLHHGYARRKQAKSTLPLSGLIMEGYWRGSAQESSGYFYGWVQESWSPSGMRPILMRDFVRYQPQIGSYEYKRLIDGEWVLDDGDPLS